MKWNRWVMWCGAGLVVVAAASGCATGNYNGAVLWNLGTRAAFDLQCPRDRLEVQPLTHGYVGAYVVTTVAGVEGCGRRATYVLTGYERGDTGAWLMNTGPAAASSGASFAELASSSRALAQ